MSGDGRNGYAPRHLKPRGRSNGKVVGRVVGTMRRRDDTERSLGVLELARRLQAMVPGSYRRLAVLAAISFGAGVLEAGLLVLLARTAVAITEEPHELELIPGVVENVSISVGIMAMLVLLACKLIAGVLIARRSAGIAIYAMSTVRVQLLRSFIGASWPVQASERQGHLQELMMTHAHRMNQVALSLAGFVAAGLNVVTLVAIAIVVDPLAAVAIVVTGGALSLSLRPFAGVLRRNSNRSARAGERLASAVSQVVSTARELHVYGTGPQALTELESLQDRQTRIWGRSRFLMLLGPEFYHASALLVLIGGLTVLNIAGPTDLADIGAVVLLLLRAFGYGQATQSTYQALNDAVPFLDRLRHQRDLYMANQARGGSRPVARIGRLELEDVFYEYIPGRPVLRGISATIEPGEAVGIIGPSGSGKSTLLQILLRLREPTAGRFLVDGVDARELELAGWYARVAFVPQDPRLIEGTVAENIAFYRDIPRRSLREAAEMANLAEEIAMLPRGYDEVIGPEDTTLSGGQQQRLTIARALAGRPDLLVLDEPTSALDMRSEARIQETLRAIHGRVTLLVVAHRMSTVAECDRVMVLTDGLVQGFDRHDALLSRSGFYEETLRLSMLQHAPAGGAA